MKRRSRSCARFGRRRSRRRSCPPATTARRCSRQPGIAHLFDTRVDGTDITRLALNGKPAPDAFLEAARRLKAEPSRAVVVEDAIAGVEAGRAGRIRLRHRRRSRRAIAGAARGRRRCRGDQPGAGPGGSGAAFCVVTGVRRIRSRAGGHSRSPVHPGERLFRDARRPRPGRWRMAFIIREPTSPAATTGCAPISPAAWWRTRISSIFRTGSRSTFRIGESDWFDVEPSSSCHTGRSSISGAACCSEPYASRTARDGARRSRSAAWFRWMTCTSARWSWR